MLPCMMGAPTLGYWIKLIFPTCCDCDCLVSSTWTVQHRANTCCFSHIFISYTESSAAHVLRDNSNGKKKLYLDLNRIDRTDFLCKKLYQSKVGF